MIEVNEQLAEVISNSQIAFLNGTLQEAFSLYSVSYTHLTLPTNSRV